MKTINISNFLLIDCFMKFIPYQSIPYLGNTLFAEKTTRFEPRVGSSSGHTVCCLQRNLTLRKKANSIDKMISIKFLLKSTSSKPSQQLKVGNMQIHNIGEISVRSLKKSLFQM